MKVNLVGKKLMMVVSFVLGSTSLIYAMNMGDRYVTEEVAQEQKPGFFNRLYEWWKRMGNRDFTLYAFPVADTPGGGFYVLTNADGTLISMPIQHRPHRTQLPSPQVGITMLADAIPGLNIYWAKGRPMVSWGDVHQYYKERNQAYMAETLVEQKTNKCFKKGAGIQIDDHWFWGRKLHYTKRVCYMNKNEQTKQDENIVVFLKATFKDPGKCNDGKGVPVKWVPLDFLLAGGLEAFHKGISTELQGLDLFTRYWLNRTLDTGGLRLGAGEKLFGLWSIALSPAEYGITKQKVSGRGQSGVAHRVTDVEPYKPAPTQAAQGRKVSPAKRVSAGPTVEEVKD